MQLLAMPVAFGSAASKSIAFVTAAWRAATPRHFLYTFVLALAWSGFLNATQSSFWARQMPWGPQLNGLLTMQFNGFAVLLAVLVADHASPPPLRRWWLYVLAVVIGAFVGSSLLWFVTQRLFEIRTSYAFPEPFETYLYACCGSLRDGNVHLRVAEMGERSSCGAARCATRACRHREARSRVSACGDASTSGATVPA